jgi:GTPase SAR1 family protein
MSQYNSINYKVGLTGVKGAGRTTFAVRYVSNHFVEGESLDAVQVGKAMAAGVLRISFA